MELLFDFVGANVRANETAGARYLNSQPFTVHRGRRRATRRAMPASDTESITGSIGLYAYGASSITRLAYFERMSGRRRSMSESGSIGVTMRSFSVCSR